MFPGFDDPVKRRILAVLQREGRLTNQELAERVGISASPCWRRVKELEESGVIRRYAALLDPQKVGVGECVFVQVELQPGSRDVSGAFERAVKERSEISECYAVTGVADFLLKIHVPDVRAYDRLLSEVILRLPGVARVRSSFALREVKYDTALPLPESEEGRR
ncbi:MAG TPA: Lrp/AsnC family transcriptional regulator [Geminicoccaceae bacterium]|nr:Lrp/AsnC family transcriptional regulator [Geminicoccaceae bacterium]